MKSPITKFTLSLVAIVSLTLLLSACGLFDKATDVTFPSSLEVEWTVHQDLGGTNVAYTHSQDVDLSTSPDIAKYIDKIKEIKIDKIVYKITDYDAAPHNTQVFFTNGVASFTATSSTTPVLNIPYTASVAGVNLQTANADTELTIDANGFNALATVFKKDKKIKMVTSGVLSKTPVSFKVKSTFYFQITANALD